MGEREWGRGRGEGERERWREDGREGEKDGRREGEKDRQRKGGIEESWSERKCEMYALTYYIY